MVDGLLAVGAIVTALGLGCAVVVHTHSRQRLGGRRITLEILGAVAVGIVVGALLGTFAADRLVAALDTDLIHLVREIDVSTYVLAVVTVLLVSVATLGITWVTRRRHSGASPNSSM